MTRAPRQSSNAVTIAMVARHAGVSTMSVSNVVNGRHVRESTREAVLQAIEALNYRPNPAARALASASAHRIGLIYPNSQSPYLSAVLVGALDATTRLGAQLLIRGFDHEGAEEPVDAVRELARSGANGLLLTAPLCERLDGVAMPDLAHLPMIGLSPGSALEHTDSVRIDDFAAAREMTDFLARRGHRRIGFITAPPTHIVSRTRLAGYRAGLTDNGIEIDEHLIEAGSLTYESGLVAAEKLLSLAERPSAIFASNDDMAAAVISVAHRRGISIPDQIAVAGFDDSPLCVKIWPTLTSVRQPIAEITAHAVGKLIERMANPDRPERKPVTAYLMHELIERGST